MASDIIARGMAAQTQVELKKYIDDVISRLPRGLVYNGQVDYFKNLPQDPELGDCYTVKYKGESGTERDGSEYAWGEYDGALDWIYIGQNPENFVKITDMVVLTQQEYDDLENPVTGTYYFIIEE